MSGIAVVGNGEATIGLVPRYLRAREHRATPAWAPGEGHAEQARQAAMADPVPAISLGLPSMTDEMRKRIADVSTPEKRRIRPMLYGIFAVAVILVGVLLFPDTVAALLPDGS